MQKFYIDASVAVSSEICRNLLRLTAYAVSTQHLARL